jgi:Radical SAM superfamily.
MNYNGFLDSTADGVLRGWAIDSSRANEPVSVTLTLSSGWTTSVLADEFRPDLRAAGLGNGHHGFTYSLPPSEKPSLVSAKITGTAFELHGSPAPVAEIPLLELVAGDIVSNCNLRCPFCIVDYEMIRGLNQMPFATFEKCLSLLPLVPDGRFWVSCMHEPTLHAEFPKILEAVPADLRRKISFTSNLCKRMPPDTLRRIAQSGVHSIRVSFDSMNPDLFGQLRKGGRFEVFIENLRQIAEFSRTAPRPIPLHVITMAFRENAAEIPDLVRRCREEFGAHSHEVRFMSYAPHLADWGEAHNLSLEQWRSLKSAVQAQSPDTAFGDPPDDVHQQFHDRRGLEHYQHPPAVFGGTATPANYQLADPLKSGFPVPDEKLRLRLRWDGLLMAEQLPEDEFRINILDLPDPRAYFLALRNAGAAASATAS